MLKEHDTAFRRMLMLSDLACVTAAFLLGYVMREVLDIYFLFRTYVVVLAVLLIIWGSLLSFFGMYESFRVKHTPEMLYIIFKAALFGFVVFGSFVYIFKLHNISRAFIVFVFIVSMLLLSIKTVALIYFFRYIRKKGFNFRNILLVGTHVRAQNFMDVIEQHKEWGLSIMGLVDEDPEAAGQCIKGYTVLGCFKDMPDIIHNNIVDEVVFVVPRSWLNKIEPLINFCELEGVKVHVAVDMFDLKIFKASQTDLNGFPLLTFETRSSRVWHLLLKRLFDIISAGGALLFLSPLFAVLAIVIRVTTHGPIFFRQVRCSLNGRTFVLYKFRTMVEDAEARLEEIRAYNEMAGPVFKMADEPRLTKIGKFLRKLSLDELPQLWNVFRGDMSLVGPRPPLPKEVTQYDNWQRRRLSMRPGITCLWQVYGRNTITDFDEWMKLDLRYIDNWSLWLDLKILFKTIPTVLFGVGAK